MRWLAVTIALLIASGTLVGAIYARDRHPDSYHASAATQARGDASTVLVTTMGWHCPGCRVTGLRRESSGEWWARLWIRHHARCVRIDLARFAFSPQTGLSGVEPASCR